MSKEEPKDILFQIDMQLYDEFNDTIATMNDHLGDIYSLRDVEEVEKAEKDKEIKLLREAVKKLQADIEIKDEVINYIAKHTYIRTGENGVLGTITEEVIEHLYKKAEEEKENEELKETLKCTQDSWFNDTQKLDKLQKENQELKNMSGIDVYKLGQKTQRDKTNFEIERLQKELDKKDKVIDILVEEIHSIVNLGEFIDRNIDNLDTKEEIKEYFYKEVEKVEEENE